MIAKSCYRLLRTCQIQNNIKNIIIPIVKTRFNPYFKINHFFCTNKVQKMQFKAETKRLLDIVAKSLYTDSEVFLRELLSNSSDALEKQRFKQQANEDLSVKIQILPTKQQIIIEDNGIGMNRMELIQNLGTIAKSGSKEYIDKIMKNQEHTSDLKDNIIGQFGVGFYSSFIVADQVQVVSKSEGQKAYKWVSDGSGQFQISEVDEDSLVRGTRIMMHIKEEHSKFVDKTQIQKIAQKYSNFINFPISIDGEATNLVKAIWSRNKNEISEEQYQKFFEYLSTTSQKYQYKMHFTSDVPLTIKAVLYIPKGHSEKFGLSQEKGQVHLYSKKVLIKKNCKQILLPHFLRFVKGVVDCQDIPLNISREHYQDNALMGKLRGFITKRILKQIKDQARKDPQGYTKWLNDFTHFIKEGSLDNEFQKDVIPLNRYEVSNKEGFIDLKEYVEMKKPNQDRIFYMFAPNRQMSKNSPYIFALNKADVPVIIANSHIDEPIFREIDTFEGLKFSNIETDAQDVERVLKGLGQSESNEEAQKNGISDQDITGYSLWIKNELQPYVDKVQVSSKKISGPALVISPISSSMRQMAFMRMMSQQKQKLGNPRDDIRNLTFEFNPKDDLIIQLNQYRKINPQNANMIIRQIFDNCCMEAGLESDGRNMVKRINKFMSQIINNKQLALQNNQNNENN